jgi:hypothetical protein
MSGKAALSKNGVVWLMKTKNFETQKYPTSWYKNLLFHTSHLPAYEDGTDRVFRNVGIYNSDTEE